jgi:hypothetical protein
VIDVRGNPKLWEVQQGGGWGAGRIGGRGRMFGSGAGGQGMNSHAVSKLMEKGVVVLLDAGARVPACPCCN